MSNLKAAYLKTILAEKQSSDLLQFFPDSLQQEIAQAPLLTSPILGKSFEAYRLLQTIHPSWFYELFDHSTQQDAQLFLSVLSQDQQEALKEHFNIKQVPHIPHKAQDFFATKLSLYLTKNKPILSPLFLPEHPLLPLLEFTSNKLHHYIKILGFFDLAIELKTIVQSSLVREISQLFSQDEIKLIHIFSKRKDLIKFTSIKLNHYKGNINQLFEVLFQRGLNRLAKGLYHAPQSFIWHIEHRLEKKHAKAIEVFKQEIKDQKISELLLKQLVEAIELTAHTQEKQ